MPNHYSLSPSDPFRFYHWIPRNSDYSEQLLMGRNFDLVEGKADARWPFFLRLKLAKGFGKGEDHDRVNGGAWQCVKKMR